MNKQIMLNGRALFLPEKHKIISPDGGKPPLSLSIPASRCLSLLISHQGEVIQREYFFREVWISNGAQVTNNTFYQNISLLRRAFKEFGINEEYIVTVPKVGVKLENNLRIELREPEEVPAYEPPPPPPPAPVQGQPPVIPRRPARRSHAGWVAMAAAIITTCAAFAWLTWSLNMDKRFTTFSFLAVNNGCTYYVNTDVKDYEIHRRFINDFKLKCDNFRYVYLTAYNNFARFSVINCLQPFSSWRTNTCTTHYYFTEAFYVQEK
ncbi:winged helix-turn-helix domain-containing protein [Dryocola sp. BD626]|uniref:winged helix-turn-helix domain-containing protein n=1 Tax=Dryocola sp. BD626 TaxID=3133273 RepID=UPI003F4FEAB0